MAEDPSPETDTYIDADFVRRQPRIDAPSIGDSEAETLLYSSTAPDDDEIDADLQLATDLGVSADAVETNAPWHAGKIIEGLYRIESVLATGGMGVVYLARDLATTETVVIKSLLPQYTDSEEYKERFLREAEEWVGLGFHPHIVRAYTLHEIEFLPRIVAEFVDGEALSELIADAPLPMDRVLSFAAQICWGMDYAHDKGIVHRDLKPGNVMVDTGNHAKVMDFGLVKRLGERVQATAAASVAPMETAGAMGTAEYMAPEQWRGRAEPASDIYSFGVLLYELLVGHRPFQSEIEGRERYVEYQRMHLRDTPPPPSKARPELPEILDELVMSCLAKTPAERPPSFRVVANRINAIAKALLGHPACPAPEARELNRKERLDQANGWLRLSSGCLQRGDRQRAHDLLRKAYQSFKALEDSTGLVNYYRIKGVLHFHSGAYSRALTMYRKGEALAEELEDELLLSSFYGNMGNIFVAQGKLSMAESMYKKTLGLARSLKDESTATRCQENIGLIYLRQNRYDEAMVYLQRALEVYEQRGDRHRTAGALSSIAVGYLGQDRLTQAEEAIRKAQPIAKFVGDRRLLAQLYSLAGDCALNRGKFEQADRLINRARELTITMGIAPLIADQMSGVPRLLFEQGKAQEAVALQRNILDALRRGEDTDVRYRLLSQLAKWLAALNINDEALACLIECRNLQQKLGILDRDNVNDRIRELGGK